mmetsp:Transcript_26369/g.73673  ORF Transcript_26369/g.73673 Transcript_26369/m.73673 type:complete len:214 (-) Transcript_26369:50-691(-)
MKRVPACRDLYVVVLLPLAQADGAHAGVGLALLVPEVAGAVGHRRQGLYQVGRGAHDFGPGVCPRVPDEDHLPYEEEAGHHADEAAAVAEQPERRVEVRVVVPALLEGPELRQELVRGEAVHVQGPVQREMDEVVPGDAAPPLQALHRRPQGASAQEQARGDEQVEGRRDHLADGPQLLVPRRARGAPGLPDASQYLQKQDQLHQGCAQHDRP